MGKLAWPLGVSLAAYLLICLLAFVFQRKLIYFPIGWTEAQARRANPGYEEVRVRTADGEEIHAWLNRVEGSPWTVIIFHGNAGNLMYHEPPLAMFREMGLQAILFDYRGYGLSTGAPSEAGLVRDSEAVREYVTTALGVPEDRIVYFGQSLGSGAAVLLSARQPPARLILESAYPSLAAVARHHYPILPAGLLVRDRFAAAEAIAAVRCPILFLHPAEDEIIPLKLGRALFEKAFEPKRFVALVGAHHNDTFEVALEAHLQAIAEFLSKPPAPRLPPADPRQTERPDR